MSLEQIKALPVASVCAPDAVLIMWTTSSHLEQALEVMRAWGFQFKSLAMVWEKIDSRGRPLMGMGKWFRQEVEISILGTRGKPKRLDRGVRQLIRAKRREHSRKPEDSYRRVENLCPGPRLEMFARATRTGWTTWGLEAHKFDR